MSCTDDSSLQQQIGASGCSWEFTKVWNSLDRTMLPQTPLSLASKTMRLIYKSGAENTILQLQDLLCAPETHLGRR